MNQSIRIAVRNVSRQKKRSLLLGGAVAFGFLIITLMNGFTAGIVSTVQENFSYAYGGHLYLSGAVVSDRGSEIPVIEDDSAAVAAIEALGDQVASVHRRSRGTGTLYVGTREQSQRIEGVDFTDEGDFRQNLTINAGSSADLDRPGALVLPDDTARKLGVEIGESLIFKVATVTGQQNVGEFILVATTGESGGIGTGSGYTAKSGLNELIGLSPDGFQTINVYLKDVRASAEAASTVYSVLLRSGSVEEKAEAENSSSRMYQMRHMVGIGGLNSVSSADRWEGTRFSLTTIEDVMAPVLSLVATLDAGAFGVFLILLVIIMVGMLNSYRMVMIERTAEIGTMRALGVQKQGIRDIFLWEALTITTIGAVSGFILALGVSGIISLFDLGSENFFSMFLSGGHLAFRISTAGSIKNLIILCLMSLAAVYLPARKASRLEPARALRASY